MINKLTDFWETLKETAISWNKSSASNDSSGLAYNAVFSLPGLLIIIVWIASHFFEVEAIKGEIARRFQGLLGREVADSVQDILVNSFVSKQSFWMKLLGISSLVFGATTLFFKLQQSLNNLWGVVATPKKAWEKFVIDRVYSFGMILIVAFLLLISMFLSSFIGFANVRIARFFGVETYYFIEAGDFILSFIVSIFLFGMMFKVLPDVEISWKSVWVGAFVTTILFNIGETIMGFYFEWSKPTSVFGAAGTIILLMMWINYTCELIFFGAEFTKVFARKNGHQIVPSKHAKWIEDNN